MESRAISDHQISASSEWASNYAAIQGRLNFQAGNGKSGAWSARDNNQNQWLQADLGSSKNITHLATQGRNAYNQWVTSYKVEYSNNDAFFHCYQGHGTDKVCELTCTCLVHPSGNLPRPVLQSVFFFRSFSFLHPWLYLRSFNLPNPGRFQKHPYFQKGNKQISKQIYWNSEK